MKLTSINPANGQTIKTYEEHTQSQINSLLVKADNAFKTWRTFRFSDRAVLMKNAGDILRNHQETYAQLMAAEMGKPIAQGRSEIIKCAWVCDYFAENAEQFLKSEYIQTEANKSYITFQPLGVILAVMPWNFPFWQVFRFAVPTLMAGNAGLLKHSSNVSGCSLAIENIFKEAGFPQDLFRSLLINSRKVGSVINNNLIKAVTLTGSTPAGQAVAEQAGRMLKKTVLELGGSDPYIILEDADLDSAASACVTSRLINSGQSCIAAKRFIIVNSVRKAFEQLFIQKMQAAVVGDPLDEETMVGPLARFDLREELDLQVQKSIQQGAVCLLGGKSVEDDGTYYLPTILTNVKKGMPAYDEELFGPVASLINAKNEKEAIVLANDSSFGLGAAVFTQDIKRGERIAAEELESGSCFVNSFVKSDPRLPFGGIKESGYGRELSYYGIKEFVNIKTVYIS